MDAGAVFALVLLGQPTLRRWLRLGALAALDQRVGLRYAISGLDVDETGGYIAHHSPWLVAPTRCSLTTPWRWPIRSREACRAW